MTRGNTYRCRVCGKTYDFCPACEIIPNPVLENGFCCREHYDIFAVLSKHGCGKATAEETLAELNKFVIPAELAPSIKEHIDAIRAEAKSVEEVKPEKDYFKKK